MLQNSTDVKYGEVDALIQELKETGYDAKPFTPDQGILGRGYKRGIGIRKMMGLLGTPYLGSIYISDEREEAVYQIAIEVKE